jgi:hypothetical protein
VFLEALQAWTNDNRQALEAAGTTVKLSDPTQWDKPSQGLILSTPLREGEVRVWMSGECEVIIGDVASGDPQQTHHELTSDQELLDVLHSFRVRFLTPSE